MCTPLATLGGAVQSTLGTAGQAAKLNEFLLPYYQRRPMIQGGGEDDRRAPKDGSSSWWTFDSGPELHMHPEALADVIG